MGVYHIITGFSAFCLVGKIINQHVTNGSMQRGALLEWGGPKSRDVLQGLKYHSAQGSWLALSTCPLQSVVLALLSPVVAHGLEDLVGVAHTPLGLWLKATLEILPLFF